jgi:formylglycine-generating enzyme required for sulfatase activity
VQHRARSGGARRALAALAAFVLLDACEKADPAQQQPTGRDAAPMPAFPERPESFPACSVRYAPRPELDSTPMCYVLGGTFEVAGLGAAKKDVLERVTIDDFLVDQREVTVDQFVAFLNATEPVPTCSWTADDPRHTPICNVMAMGPPPPFELRDGRFAVKAGREGVATHGIDAAHAEAYCRWAGKVMLTRAQWDRAARIDQAGRRLVYPWGDQPDWPRMNCDEKRCQDGFVEAAPPGSLRDVSPWGVLDMAGNVEELVHACESGACGFASAGVPFNGNPDWFGVFDTGYINPGLRCALRRPR